jgi:PilZ domain
MPEKQSSVSALTDPKTGHMIHFDSRMATEVVMSKAVTPKNANKQFSGTEKRLAQRYDCNLTAGWRLLGAADLHFLPGAIQDISRSGFALRVQNDCKKGAILSVRLEDVPEKLTGPWLARAVNTRQAEPGIWIIGCAFCCEFTQADLDAILESCLQADLTRASSAQPPLSTLLKHITTQPPSSTYVKPLSSQPASSTSIRPVSTTPPSSASIRPVSTTPPSSAFIRPLSTSSPSSMSIRPVSTTPPSSTSIRPLTPPPPPPPNQKERRSFPRRDAKRLGIIVALPNGKRYFGRLVNASANGIALAMPRSLELGAVVKVRATSAGISVPWASVQVKHCRRVNHESIVGCQFTDTLSASLVETFCPTTT